MLGITAVRTRGTFLRRTVRKYFSRTNTFKKYVLITQKKINFADQHRYPRGHFWKLTFTRILNGVHSYSPMKKKLVLRTFWNGLFFEATPYYKAKTW